MNASTTTISDLSHQVAAVASQEARQEQPALTRTISERNALVEELMPFVESIAKRVSRDIRGKIELDELIAWGVTGLLESIDRYQDDRNASLKTFAYYRIRGSMLDNIGKIAPLTRSAYRCAGAAGDKLAIYRSGIDTCEIPDSEETSPEERVSRRQQYQVLERAMKCLSKDHRHLVQQHYFGEQTLKDAGETLGKSKSWACRSHAAALGALRTAMESSVHLAA